MLDWLRKIFGRKKSMEDLELEDLKDYCKDLLINQQQYVDEHGRDSTAVCDDEDNGEE